MPAPDYERMTIEQLQTELRSLAAVLDATYSSRGKVLALIEKRKAEAMAAAKVRAMTPLERDALKTALSEGQP